MFASWEFQHFCVPSTSVNAPLDALPPIFAHNEVALVCEGDKFVGLITRIDLINYIRLNP